MMIIEGKHDKSECIKMFDADDADDGDDDDDDDDDEYVYDHER